MKNYYRILEWSGSFFCLLASLLIASNTGSEILAYIIFTISNLLMLKFCYALKLYGLLTLNIAFLFINGFGLIRWMLY